MKRRGANKQENIKHWKMGVNHVKDISVNYSRTQRGGIRL